MSKQFGLILPGSKKVETKPKSNTVKPSVFGSDSDSDDGFIPMKKASIIGPGLNEKIQAKKLQEKALKEDPTIFQYDELYDDIENKRDQEKKEKNKEERKPKYIGRLLACAERRKLDNERRLERLIQKERELEGEEFKDKESFVTSAYRKKLEELKKAEEKEKREEYLEAIGDVTKQQNLDGFYRHLYEQKLGTKDVKELENISKNLKENNDEDMKSKEHSFQSSSTNKLKLSTKPRTYRKRQSSDESEEENAKEKEEVIAKKAHLQSNLDADSDFSIDSSSEDEEGNDKQSVEKSFEENIQNNKQEEAVSSKTEVEEQIETKNDVKEENENKQKKLNENKTEDQPVKENKKDIWKKRTIGEVFEAALQRYFERKAARNG